MGVVQAADRRVLLVQHDADLHTSRLPSGRRRNIGRVAEILRREGAEVVDVPAGAGDPQPDSSRRADAAASSLRELISSLAKTCARWVWTVRRETNNRSPICGFDRPSATSSTTVTSVGVAVPAHAGSTVSDAGAAADTEAAQRRRGSGRIAVRLQLVVDADGLLQQVDGFGAATASSEQGARVFAG